MSQPQGTKVLKNARGGARDRRPKEADRESGKKHTQKLLGGAPPRQPWRGQGRCEGAPTWPRVAPSPRPPVSPHARWPARCLKAKMLTLRRERLPFPAPGFCLAKVSRLGVEREVSRLDGAPEARGISTGAPSRRAPSQAPDSHARTSEPITGRETDPAGLLLPKESPLCDTNTRHRV